MDWQEVLSLSPEGLSEEVIEEVHGTITWHDFDDEILTSEQYLKIIKLCQEIMKFRGQQVQTLLYELDALAVKHAEVEVKKMESDAEGTKSVQSPDSREHSEIERKYSELKLKYKQQLKVNDKNKRTMEQLKQKLSDLEEERNNLQSELQRMNQEGSQSDVSENIKEQQKELIDTVHHKNKQLSDLLRDIEAVEKENLLLREELSKARDELTEATNQFAAMSDEIAISEAKLKESLDEIEKLEEEKVSLKHVIDELDEEKQQLQRRLDEFTVEINEKKEKWKEVLNQKNEEIKNLKSQIPVQADTSSNSSELRLAEKSNIAILNDLLLERDAKIDMLQSQLQVATNEMEETTKVIKELTEERNRNSRKIEQLVELQKDIKNQLITCHERCQELQEQIDYAERKFQEKDTDLKKLFSDLKKDGCVELSAALAQIQNLKGEKYIREKRIADLVKTCNKLQQAFDEIQIENEAMRNKLGLKGNETVGIGDVLIKRRKQKQLEKGVEEELVKLEEEKIQAKLELKKLHRVVANLYDQLIGLGATPNTKVDEIDYSAEKSDAMKLRSETTINAISEENEALRKGLHEILESLNKKSAKGTRTINSNTLERLLRALDVKHIAGWYHPAMRLQAELHALQGVNAELRKELQTARVELNQHKSQKESLSTGFPVDPKYIPPLPIQFTGDSAESETEIISILNQHLLNVLESFKRESSENKLMKDKLQIYSKEFADLHELFLKFNESLKAHSEQSNSKIQELATQNKALEESAAISEAKLNEFVLNANLSDDELSRAKHSAELASKVVILNRKCLFLENQETSLKNELNRLKDENLTLTTSLIQTKSEFSSKKHMLETQILMFENEHATLVDSDTVLKTQRHLDNIVLKYRQLVQEFKDTQDDNEEELKILKESVKHLDSEKKELTEKLRDVLAKLHSENRESPDSLAKRLAECEVNEITERQRANHINNLYELVKEQLQKSEDRFKEFEQYNKEIMHKNLLLQENLKDLEDRLINHVDMSVYKEVQLKCSELLKENEALLTANMKLTEDFKILETSSKSQKLWTTLQEYELLSLKHQVVDLQAETDEKTVIARLSFDVVQARLSEANCEKKLNDVNEELKEMKSKYAECEDLYNKEKEMFKEHRADCNKKLRALQDTISRQRLLYLGSIPLSVEEKYVQKLRQLTVDKKETFKALFSAQKYETECEILKEDLKKETFLLKEMQNLVSKDNSEKIKAFINMQEDKRAVQLQEVKSRRMLDFKVAQLRQALKRIEDQEDQLSKLEEELLKAYSQDDKTPPPSTYTSKELSVPEIAPAIKLFNSQSSQTQFEVIPEDTADFSDTLNQLQLKLIDCESELSNKNTAIDQLKSKITELEMNISMFRKQLGDKQSQITFYERHILELQNKKHELNASENGSGDNGALQSGEEHSVLKASINSLQLELKLKEDEILRYQALLKQDRDEHSLAAARMQEELKKLQQLLVDRQTPLEESQDKSSAQVITQHPGKAAIDHYISQVHQLEKHTAELHTTVASLNSQLQASRLEAVRWKCLANDRLETMEELRKDLEMQYQNEIGIYKNDCEKLQHEVASLKFMLSKQQNTVQQSEVDGFNKMLKERDDKIHELSVLLRQAKSESRRVVEKEKTDDAMSPKINELILSKEQLLKEHETLKRRFDQLLNKERSAKEEIRNLQSQLFKRPMLSARSDKSDKSIKDLLQKKISSLEKEVYDLKTSLEKQLAMNEVHKMKIAEDFDRWNKLKHWQQTAEKLKAKLKETQEALDKQSQTSAGYRLLIERLEKEKHNQEMRIKHLKSQNPFSNLERMEALRSENSKLQAHIEVLTTKLEMQQHHSGGLGAAMLQEKLEAQERKIAVLEVTAKGTVEVRSELERLQTSVADLQKRNLCLEAENLELRLDLEKSSNEVPHLREQIEHLEKYIQVLKTENSSSTTGCLETIAEEPPSGSRKIAELEKTVFLLKRVVEKFKVENKRLQSGSRLCTLGERGGSSDSLRRDLARMKQEYGDAVQKIARLEQELASANSKIKALESKPPAANLAQLSGELDDVKMQLNQKSILLDKVKVLLQRAAVKEKELLDEIDRLRKRLMERGDEISSRE